MCTSSSFGGIGGRDYQAPPACQQLCSCVIPFLCGDYSAGGSVPAASRPIQSAAPLICLTFKTKQPRTTSRDFTAGSRRRVSDGR